MERTDVVVVGAGPVGLLLAIGLVRSGVKVHVLDRAPPGRGEPRAAVLWPRTQRLFDRWGLMAPFEALGLPVRRTTVWSGRRRLGTLRFGRGRDARRTPLAIEQHDTQRLLVDALAVSGVEVERPCEAVALSQDGESVVARVRGPDGGERELRAQWLVGCDGAHSFVRHALGVPFRGGPRRDLQVLQVNANPSWRGPSETDGGQIVLAPGVSVSLYPMPGGTHRIFAFAHDPEPQVDAPPTLEQMRRLLAEAAHAPELTLSPTEPVWLNRARFQQRTAARLRVGRVLLCGDAAHVWAPVGGRGMNVGLHAADDLARTLAAVVAGAPERALDGYARRSRARARRVRWATRFDLLELPPRRWMAPVLAATIRVLLSWRLFRAAVDRALNGAGRRPPARLRNARESLGSAPPP